MSCGDCRGREGGGEAAWESKERREREREQTVSKQYFHNLKVLILNSTHVKPTHPTYLLPLRNYTVAYINYQQLCTLQFKLACALEVSTYTNTDVPVTHLHVQYCHTSSTRLNITLSNRHIRTLICRQLKTHDTTLLFNTQIN